MSKKYLGITKDKLEEKFKGNIVIDDSTFISLNQPAKFYCKTHNIEFTKKAVKVLESKGCKYCAKEHMSQIKRLSTEEAIKKFVNVHGDTYDYSKVDYVNIRTPVEIICKIHGSYFQKPAAHLVGCGCQICNKQGWKTSDWVSFCKFKNRDLTFYMVKLFDSDEKFVKVGITSRSLEDRMYEIPYNFEMIFTMKGCPKILAQVDKEVLAMFKQYKYVPKLAFGGMNECLSPVFLEELEAEFQYLNKL